MLEYAEKIEIPQPGRSIGSPSKSEPVWSIGGSGKTVKELDDFIANAQAFRDRFSSFNREGK